MTTPEERANNACQLFEILERGHATVNRARFIAIVTDAIRAALAEERAACAAIADAQADSLAHELPDGAGGTWTKRFARNVALAIAQAIRARWAP